MGDTKSKKQFFFLQIDTDSRQAWLLGYPISFSPTEIKILSALCDRHPISGEDILADIGSSADKSCLSAHICSINKKAEKASGRKLIIHTSYGYSLNPNL